MSKALPLFAFLMANAAAQSMISYRTPQDVAAGEAAQAAELKMVGLGLPGTYRDPEGIGFPYHVYAPPHQEAGTKYPMYIYWEMSGQPRLAMPSSEAAYPVYVVTVNCDGSQPGTNHAWKMVSANALKAVADTVIAKYGNIDIKRIYTGGFSKAGGVAWQAVLNNPDFFAAIVPSSASIPDLGAASLVVSRKVAVWMFQGGPSDMVTASRISAPYIREALIRAGGNPRYTEYRNLGHHEPWLSDSVSNREWQDFTTVRAWLFAQKRP